MLFRCPNDRFGQRDKRLPDGCRDRWRGDVNERANVKSEGLRAFAQSLSTDGLAISAHFLGKSSLTLLNKLGHDFQAPVMG